MHARYSVEPIARPPRRSDRPHHLPKRKHFIADKAPVVRREAPLTPILMARSALAEARLGDLVIPRERNIGVTLLHSLDTQDETFSDITTDYLAQAIRTDIPHLRRGMAMNVVDADVFSLTNARDPVVLLPNEIDEAKIRSERLAILDSLRKVVGQDFSYLYRSTPHLTIGRLKESATKKEKRRVKAVMKEVAPDIGRILLRPARFGEARR